ncbi:hypothetical protein P152DRAFT_487322 [Eremomyces bilateralis CBS 781.70]|uniref:Uncharacterized protein n=1 Tax=Eremomyces bilateralis CBS 781.70 TaxID=1392243 RepID=A0A6G1GHL0_9PEZI|nr:uncharacterized protein P152DRAFT_487322 [Eremomyces bilateralis CBS 781.70]KAF1817585.1 hypothetical protein P152DRAFT_487322 [Eremomyces bilateralis CBS 781.70]
MLVARAISHAVKRGVHTDPRLFDIDAEAMIAWKQFDPTLPWWGGSLLWSTVFAFIFMLYTIHYSVGHVMSTCAMIESSKPTTIFRISLVEKEKEPSSDDHPDDPLFVDESTTIPAIPLTRHIRTFRTHLRSLAGPLSSYRALHYGALYLVAFGSLHYFLAALLRFPVGNYIAVAIASAAVAPLHAAWTHATIAMPSDKRMGSRLAHARRGWKAISLTAAMWGITNEVVISMARMAAEMVALDRNPDMNILVLTTCMSVFSVLYYLFITVRMEILLVRLEAAYFPIDEETIVPMDGSICELMVVEETKYRVNPVAMKKESRGLTSPFKRVLLIIGKLMVIDTAMILALVNILLLELYLCWGEQLVMVFRAFKASYQLYLKKAAEQGAAQAEIGIDFLDLDE